MKKNLAAILLAVVFLFSVSQAASAEVNLRTKNLADRIDRILTGRFIPNYYIVDQGKSTNENGGVFKGDAEVYRVYYPLKKAEYDAVKKDNSIVLRKYTKIVIYVDFYKTPADALKNAPKKGFREGSFSGETIGEESWNGSGRKKDIESLKAAEERKKAKEEEKTGKPSTSTKKLSQDEMKAKAAEDKKLKEEQDKKDMESAKALERDPKNFNYKTLIVAKKTALINVSAVNYVTEPDPAILEALAKKIAAQII